ncbi:MAG: hypothetical protein GY796_04810, partial [Chloroflexi bacterium]|nr:hypothetical protein [Chloroflexota bacterium]
LDTYPALLIVIGLQTILVLIGLSQRWRSIWGWLIAHFKMWQLLLIAGLFLVPSATVSEPASYYPIELMIAALIQAISLGNIVLAAWLFPVVKLGRAETFFNRLLGERNDVSKGNGRLDRVVVLAAIWVFAAAAFLNWFSYEQHPHVPDEFAYIYHARYLAEGLLKTPAPPVPDAFDVYLMQFDGDEWYPSPPVGWPAILSIGARLGADWLVNPILAGLSLLVTFLLLQALYSRRTARISILLLAVSPWFIFLAMSYMTHMSTLAAALTATLCVLYARTTKRAIWGWLGGIALGMIALIRPLEAIAIAGLLGLWAIGLGGKRLSIPTLAGLVLAAVAVGGAALSYNQAITGNPTLFPIMAYTNERFGPNANSLGFGPDRGMGWALDPNPGHSPLDATINANLNTFSLNTDLLGWSIGSLIFILIVGIAGRRQKRDYFWWAVIGVIFTIHFFYYYSGGPDFGARYWFLMLIPLIALSARGIEAVEERFSVATLDSNRVLIMVMALCVVALVTFFPWRAVDKYHHFRGMRPDIRQLAADNDFGRSLVLISGDSHPDYASAAIYNPLDMYADTTIYVWDRSPELRRQVLAAYADRPVWLVDGPTVSGGQFEIVDGPLTAAELYQAP